jgi:hypothetical protein
MTYDEAKYKTACELLEAVADELACAPVEDWVATLRYHAIKGGLSAIYFEMAMAATAQHPPKGIERLSAMRKERAS